MSDKKLGRTECVATALGGMIGGGIFAVLGVVAQMVHGGTWVAFVLAGLVALCASYAYNTLNEQHDEGGGATTFIHAHTGSSTVAGMMGWTLLFGYVGSMAMYAYAFGSFAVGLEVLPESVAGLPLRPVLSVLAVAAFAGLNLLGARSTGLVEDVMVALKVLILVVLGVGGLYYGFTHDRLELGVSELAGFGPVMAAAMSFVAFQGWQLLYYDQESIEDPVDTIREAVYISIAAAVTLYVIVAVTTVSLAPLEVIAEHPERALAVAADPFMPYGFTIISVAALFSTGSAINATLFSSGHFAKKLLSSELLPDRLGDEDTDGLPTRTVVGLAAVTAAFAAYGGLSAITSFASLAFIVVFGVTGWVAFRNLGGSSTGRSICLVATSGAALFLVLMFWHLWRSERGTFYSVVVITVAVVLVELLYFERDVIETKVPGTTSGG